MFDRPLVINDPFVFNSLLQIYSDKYDIATILVGSGMDAFVAADRWVHEA